MLEASEIEEFLNKNADISAKQLSKFISNLFSEKFGNDIFRVDENKIIEISKEILESKCNWNITNRFWKTNQFFLNEVERNYKYGNSYWLVVAVML